MSDVTDHEAEVLSSEVLVIKRSDLFELLGEVALPPFPCGCGTEIDCAPIAQSLRERIERMAI